MGVGITQGLKIGELWVGSIFADTVSGAQFAVGPGEIGFTELADSAVSGAKLADQGVSGTKLLNNTIGFGQLASNAISGTAVATGGIGTIAKIFAGVIDADTNTLSSGSRWITFRQAFAAKPFVLVGYDLNARTADLSRDGDWVAVGSTAAGSALVVGSPATYAFNWVAVGSR